MSFISLLNISPYLAITSFVSRYLKGIFRDLFERQSFEDDGVFDWDILRKKQQQASARAGVNVEGERQGAAVPDSSKPGPDTGAGAADSSVVAAASPLEKEEVSALPT